MMKFQMSSPFRQSFQRTKSALLLSVLIILGLFLSFQSAAQVEDRAGPAQLEAQEIAKDFLERQRNAAPIDLDVDGILRQAEQFSAEADALTEDIFARLEAEGQGGSAQFFDENGKIDAGALAAAAGDMARNARESAEDKPLFLTFVSLGMPDSALRSLIKDTHAAGGQVVVRGLYGGSYTRFSARVQELMGETDTDMALAIDPRYFQAVGVEVVPTFAIVLAEPECEGFVCAPFGSDRISGNISVAAALELLAEKGSFAPSHARAAYAILEKGMP